jgi:hypothetical protein
MSTPPFNYGVLAALAGRPPARDRRLGLSLLVTGARDPLAARARPVYRAPIW